MSEPTNAVVAALSSGLTRIRSTPPRIIASPATQPRRAAVAIIMRVAPSPTSQTASSSSIPPPPVTLNEFFAQDWVNEDGVSVEVLFLRRDSPQSERDVAQNMPRNAEDAHVAFPGGRMETGDEGGLYTAMRQTWEEIGVDLAEKDFMLIGQLDDREITTSLGKRLLMILSPFVFLQVVPKTPTPDPVEGTYLHWVPLASLLASATVGAPRSIISPRGSRQWTTVTVDVSSRLAPRQSSAFRIIVRMLLGSMQFNAILLQSRASTADNILTEKRAPEDRHQTLKLWGLSLGMTLDLIACMNPAKLPFAEDLPRDEVTGLGMNIAPSMTSVFPRFSYPDVNFWIWVFGKRYREVLRNWEFSASTGGANDKRINWIGTAVNQFYAAMRKALIVVLVLRAIGLIIGLSIGAWWVFGN